MKFSSHSESFSPSGLMQKLFNRQTFCGNWDELRQFDYRRRYTEKKNISSGAPIKYVERLARPSRFNSRTETDARKKKKRNEVASDKFNSARAKSALDCWLNFSHLRLFLISFRLRPINTYTPGRMKPMRSREEKDFSIFVFFRVNEFSIQFQAGCLKNIIQLNFLFFRLEKNFPHLHFAIWWIIRAVFRDGKDVDKAEFRLTTESL